MTLLSLVGELGDEPAVSVVGAARLRRAARGGAAVGAGLAGASASRSGRVDARDERRRVAAV